MAIDFYPWNVRALVEWLQLEMSYHPNRQDLAEKLDLPYSVLRHWLTSANPTLELNHLHAISHYRRQSLTSTIAWLELKPAHVEALLAEASDSQLPTPLEGPAWPTPERKPKPLYIRQ